MTTIHASVVAVEGRGLLILGPSGAGKSSLALALMAQGALLVADDRVLLDASEGQLIAACPAPLLGRIEARGVGILAAPPAGPTPLVQVVDLGRGEAMRLPPRRSITLLGIALPLVLGPMGPHLAPALRQLLLGGRCD